MKYPPILLVLISHPAQAAAVPFFAGDGAGSERTQKTLPAAAEGAVVIENVSGQIRVEVSDRAEVSLDARVDCGADRLTFEREGDRTRVRVKSDGDRRCGGADLALIVPRKSRLEVQTTSAEIDLRGVSGGVRIQTVSGDVALDQVSGGVSIMSVSAELQLKLAGGDVETQSVSGDAEISLGTGTGAVRVKSVSGDIAVEAQALTAVRVQTVSGDIRLKGGVGDRGPFTVESQSGDIALQLPDATRAQLRLETFSGQLDSSVKGEETSSRRGHGPGEKRQIALGSGGPEVALTTFSGDIRVGLY
ncbi:MAG: DUF4097 family beta strand repeat protein [Deltaproteobacteria bacterium]|nr:DUF4097 family beta strand repeat protein [Deltaproteobacteria bacterium]